jgi:3-phosphoglycerate kinase
MYQEEREILLLQREKYKLKMIETLLETRSKVVSTKGALTVGGTALATFLAYKGLNWVADKTKKETKETQSTEKETKKADFWGSELLDQLKEQAIVMLIDVAKEQLQNLITKKKK